MVGKPITVRGPHGPTAPELVCPHCRAQLDQRTGLECTACGAIFRIHSGIPDFTSKVAAHDPHKAQQSRFFDEADTEWEIERPDGASKLYGWLIDEKFRRSLEGIQLPAGATALVICGGSGMDAEFLAKRGLRVVVSDISKASIQRAFERARRHGFELTGGVVADAESLPFADMSFDLVYVHDGLHHLERPFAALREMTRLASVAVSVNEPAQAAATRLAVRIGLSEDEEDAGNHIGRLRPGDVTAEIQRGGFRVVHTSRYTMVYRHKPGVIFEALSSRSLLPLTRAGVTFFNRIAPNVGNKLTIQALRQE